MLKRWIIHINETGEWVKRLPAVIAAINSETKKPPPIEIKTLKDSPICPTVNLRYLYQPGEQEGGGRRRATDPIWSVDIHKINYYIVLQGIRVYYLRSPAPSRICQRRITYRSC